MTTRRSLLLGAAGVLALVLPPNFSDAANKLSTTKAGRPGAGGGGGTTLAPSAAWDKTLDSGWGGANYAKPTADTRTVAMPVCRPLFPQFTPILSNTTLVFAADALPGISKVRISLEGNYLDVNSASWYSYVDERGSTRWLYGYGVTIDWTAAQAAQPGNGTARICAEAYANDGTFQKQLVDRIIHIRTSRYDTIKTVNLAGTAGNVTLPAALAYAATHTSEFVGIKIVESGNYDHRSTSTLLAATHYTEVYADTGVTAVMGDYSQSIYRVDVDGVRFYGPGIKIVTSVSKNLTWALSFNPSANGVMQFQGVEITGGDGGASHSANEIEGTGSLLLYQGGQPGQYWIGNYTGKKPEFFNCYAHGLPGYAFFSAESVVNCDVDDVSGSCYENVCCVHGGSATKVGGVLSGLVTHVHALDIAYSGAGTASLSRTTTSNGSTGQGNGGSGFLNLYVNSSFVVSFNLGAYYTTSQLASAINTWSAANGNAWTATNDSANTRGSAYLSRSGQVPSYIIYPAVSFSAGAISLTTIMDIHADVFVTHGVGVPSASNRLASFVNVFNLCGSAGISDNGDGCQDVVYSNIFIEDTSATNGFAAQNAYLAGTFAHFVIRNSTWIGTDAGEHFTLGHGDMDAYTAIYNVYMDNMNWNGSTVDTDVKFKSLVTRKYALPSGASGTNASKQLGNIAESGYINGSGVPIVGTAGGGGSDLLTSNGNYAGCYLPTSLATAGNRGYNLAL